MYTCCVLTINVCLIIVYLKTIATQDNNHYALICKQPILWGKCECQQCRIIRQFIVYSTVWYVYVQGLAFDLAFE